MVEVSTRSLNIAVRHVARLFLLRCHLNQPDPHAKPCEFIRSGHPGWSRSNDQDLKVLLDFGHLNTLDLLLTIPCGIVYAGVDA